MGSRFGTYLVYMTLSSLPFLYAAHYINGQGSNKFADFGFFGLAVLLLGIVCIYGVNCYIAYKVMCKEQQDERHRIQDEVEAKLREAEEDRKKLELQAKLTKEVVELKMKQEKQEHELEMSRASEMSKLQLRERREAAAAITDGQKKDFKAMGDVILNAFNERLNIPVQNNLSKQEAH